MSQFTVTVVGLGKIGMPLAAQYASRGLAVHGADVNPDVVAMVNAGKSPVIEEAGLEEAVAKARQAEMLDATTDTALAVSQSNVVVLVVPLMVDRNKQIDYRIVDSASADVARGLQPGTLVIFETTLPVGTTRKRIGPILEQGSGLKQGRDFMLAFSPERVYSGRIFADLRNYPKIVGGVDEASAARAVEFYRAALDEGTPIKLVANAETAEFVKLAETTYRDVNIALANEFARFAASNGIDALDAFDAANTQPYSHIHKPGVGVGGHCIPVYPYFLLDAAAEGELDLVRRSRALNDSMAAYSLDLLERELGSLQGKRVLVLGLSYRENVKEDAFSTAHLLIAELKRRSAHPLLHDPLWTAEELERHGDSAESVADIYAARPDAVVLQAYHQQYARLLDWPRLAEASCRVILDGRNAVRNQREAIEAAGLKYVGVGQ
ncbi:MAG: nucleotide sugar dehydrogenase [Candidatus Chloroheliales bacterium]|nr:MAG: nucleotide sugar dehydrogenase [Chloroflexota bacterium]